MLCVVAEGAGLAVSVRGAGQRPRHPLDEGPPLHLSAHPGRQLRRASHVPRAQLLQRPHTLHQTLHVHWSVLFYFSLIIYIAFHYYQTEIRLGDTKTFQVTFFRFLVSGLKLFLKGKYIFVNKKFLSQIPLYSFLACCNI